ncbi:PilZ domain protein [Poriferisphaera corsica]|uniref:PilZ domain protein n=1 Tax=Poriferisphaera corsica TaxID=2528020 RepID=A0A517YVB1_9BACT|nr:PilZ domain-containing protein [Poriferisphaera corsica]QDU34147.1 PilZ domain protein [Poriferisphaera corsica]
MPLTLGPQAQHEGREHPRIPLPAMYTLLRLRKLDAPHFDRTGHIYDISMSGIRFELDFPLEPGEQVEVKIMLPGSSQLTFSASGTIIRMHTDDECGPVRMGLAFNEFGSINERIKLQQYINYRGFLPEDAPSRAA